MILKKGSSGPSCVWWPLGLCLVNLVDNPLLSSCGLVVSYVALLPELLAKPARSLWPVTLSWKGHLGAIVGVALLISPFLRSARSSTGVLVLLCRKLSRNFRNPLGFTFLWGQIIFIGFSSGFFFVVDLHVCQPTACMQCRIIQSGAIMFLFYVTVYFLLCFTGFYLSDKDFQKGFS